MLQPFTAAVIRRLFLCGKKGLEMRQVVAVRTEAEPKGEALEARSCHLCGGTAIVRAFICPPL